MKLEDPRSFHFIVSPNSKQPNFRVTTFDAEVLHLVHGHCRMVIRRAVGNDSHLKAQMTKEALAKHEPNVGMWPGDFIEYHALGGGLLERIEA